MAKKPPPSPAPVEPAFAEVVQLIHASRQQAMRAVNTALIDLYWHIGAYLHHKIEADGWAKGTVVQLAAYIAQREPGVRGFSPQNLWRMRQFFQTYQDDSKLSPLLRVLPWSSHLHILSRAKRSEEREFYLRMATQNRWPVREVARQIDSALFERTILNPPKLSTALRELQPQAEGFFKDVYQLDFLGLSAGHSELDLHHSLLQHLGRFLTELGRDFCYIGTEYPLQVGNQDFALDLLFFHRGLNCLVAIELKVTAFAPEHLGKLNFYLEALDRDHRKPHENPAIGLLLCASKDSEVERQRLTSPSRSAHPWPRAVCGVANPRHSPCYVCGLRLASHPDPGRAASRGLIQRRLNTRSAAPSRPRWSPSTRPNYPTNTCWPPNCTSSMR